MKNWKIYSIVITIILILAIISGILYFFVFKENITEDEAKKLLLNMQEFQKMILQF